MVGEEPLEVVLHQGVQHAHDRRDEPEDQHDRPPPPGKIADEIEDDADDAVDGGLEHDAAHQGRDVRRRDRVGLGQPDMERDHAGLGGEPEEGEQEGQGRQPAGSSVSRMASKV